MLPTAIIARHVRKNLTVCLGGDGGDELFAGYNRHSVGSTVERLTRRAPRIARRSAAFVLDSTPLGILERVPSLRRVPASDDKRRKLSALLRHEGGAWDSLAGVWPRAALGCEPLPISEPPLDPSLTGLDDLLLRDFLTVLPDLLLAKVDRASMHVGLEVRVPLLDPALVAWAWSLSNRRKTDGRTGKLILREAALRLLPESTVNRPKVGFDPPIAHWLRTDLRDWAEQIIRSSRVVGNGWLRQDFVDAAWADHVHHGRNREYQLWSLLMLELWLAEYHP